MKLTTNRAAIVLITLLAGSGVATGAPVAVAEAPASPIETGSVDIDTSWSTVTLDRAFRDPVVVVGPPTASDAQPTTVRVRNVTSTSFQVRLQDWEYAKRAHGAERVPFMVMEAGKQVVSGRTWYAGHADRIDHSWRRIGVTGFGGDQVVLGSVVSSNGDQAVALRVDAIDKSGFRIRLEEQRISDRRHAAERVDYVVVPCCTHVEGMNYSAGRVATAATTKVAFAPMPEPLLFANVSTVNEADAVTLRNVASTNGSVTIGMDEEQSAGASKHATEQIRYVAIDGGTTTLAGAPAPTTVPATTLPTTTLPTTTEPATTAPATTLPATTTTTPVTTVPATTAPIAPIAPIAPTTTVPMRGTCLRPTNTVRIEPGQNIAASAKTKPEGTTFLLAAGTHRLADVSPKLGQTFVGERGPSCERLTTLSGAEQVTSWAPAGGKWKSTGHSRAVDVRTVPCEDGFPRCQHPQDLYVNGNPLRHVGSLAAVTAGTWFFDYDAKAIWVGDNPTGKNVELSVAEAAFRPTADNVRIVGLKMEKYANRPQFGVIGRHGTAPGWVIEDNEIGVSHSVAAVLGTRARFVNNHVSRQGGLGVKVNGASVTATGNTIVDTGWAGQLMTWEGGGLKTSASGANVSGNCIANNRGPGLWGDEAAHGVTFDRNTVFGNVTQGIFYEISDTATISNNRVGHNGQRSPWMYGGQIMISTSSNVLVVGNTVEVNKSYGNGITIIWQDRHMGGAYGNTIRSNDVTFLSDTGVTGMRTDWTGGEGIYRRNTFSGNRYHSRYLGNTHFKGVDGSMTIAELQRTGQEVGSRIDSDVRATTWSCPAP